MSCHHHSFLTMKGQWFAVRLRAVSILLAHLNIPKQFNSAFSALRCTPDEFGQELLIAAVVKWYEIGMISQSKAAEISDINRQAFLAVLNRFEVSPSQTTPEELEEELNSG